MIGVPVSKKQQACVNRYVKEKYDRINVTMAKGRKEILRQAAEKYGLSINGYINLAIAEKLEKDVE